MPTFKINQWLTGIRFVAITLIVSWLLAGCTTGRVHPEAFYTDKGVIKLCKAARKGDLKTIDRLVAKGVGVSTVQRVIQAARHRE